MGSRRPGLDELGCFTDRRSCHAAPYHVTIASSCNADATARFARPWTGRLDNRRDRATPTDKDDTTMHTKTETHLTHRPDRYGYTPP